MLTDENIEILKQSYDFTIDIHGELCGLTNGDHCFEGTGVKLEKVSLEIWNLGLKAWDELNKK